MSSKYLIQHKKRLAPNVLIFSHLIMTKICWMTPVVLSDYMAQGGLQDAMELVRSSIYKREGEPGTLFLTKQEANATTHE